MVIYSTQQDAFDARKSHQKIFQNQTERGRYYVAETAENYWFEYLRKGKRFGYELLEKDKPCHLFIDLDVNKQKYPGISVNDIWCVLEKYIDNILIQWRDIPTEDIVKQLHFSSSEKKGSMHILYKIKGRIFESVAHVGAFMRCVQQFIETEHEEDMAMYDNKIVDMGIYTPNRLFRMLGCTKFGENRYLTDSHEYTFDHWVNNLVQPLKTTDTFIDVREPGGSSPKYSSGSGCSGITGWTPDCVTPLMGHIEEKYGRITRIHAFMMSMTFACNLETKNCPFKGAEHSSNVIYAVINLADFSYRIRCHSAKCHGRALPINTDPGTKFPEELKFAVDEFLNQPITVPSIGHAP